MKTVHKFGIGQPEPGGLVAIEMPEDSEVLFVGEQGGLPMLWARVDTEKPKVERVFRVGGTGHNLEKGLVAGKHLGTFFMGPLVWHLFDPVPIGGE